MASSLAALVGGAVAWPPGPTNASLKQLKNLAPEDIHVLLVDDERLSRVVVGNLLRKCNYRVTAAGSGQEALEILRRSVPGTFQLVLTDVMMPDVDGIELLRFLRGNESFAAVPVVMMSANEHTDTVFECIRGGAEDYLLKPVTKKEVQYIWQHVWRRQQQNAMRVPNIQEEETDESQRGRAAPSVPSASAAVLPHPEASGPSLRPAAAPAAAGTASQTAQQAQSSAEAALELSALPAAGVFLPPPAPAPAQPQLPAPLGFPAYAPTAVGAADSSQRARALVAQVASAAEAGTGRPPLASARVAGGATATAARGLPAVDRQRHVTVQRSAHSVSLAEYFVRRKTAVNFEDSFRIFCQVLGLLQKCHVRGIPLGRVRPSQLRVTAAGAVFADATPAPPSEVALYAAPEETAWAEATSLALAANGHPAAAAPDGARSSRAPVIAAAGVAVAAPAESSMASASAAAKAAAGRPSAPADVFSLGILFFELFHPVAGGPAERVRTLSELRHRVLPMQLLQGRPQEAALLAVLLHPQPASRPTVESLLRSNLLSRLHAAFVARRAQAASVRQPAASEPAAAPQVSPAATVARSAEAPSLLSREQQAMSEPSPAAGPTVAPQPPSAEALAAAEDQEVLLNFLRLLRRRKATESQRVAAQLASVQADLAEAKRRLAVVLESAGSARPEGLALPEGSDATAVDAPASPQGAAQPAAAVAAMQCGQHAVSAADSGPASRKRRRDGMDAQKPVTIMEASAVAAAASGEGSGEAPAPPHRPSHSQPRSAKIARVMSAFATIDSVYTSRQAGTPGAAHAAACREADGPPTRLSLAAGPASVSSLPPAATVADTSSTNFEHLTDFQDDLAAFARYSEFKVRATLKYGDLLAAPDMVCSTSFDRDDEYFATAGVSRRIKVFETASVLDQGAGIHYPVHEVLSRSKLSCVCWNSYIKSNLIASDYDGTITLHDLAAGAEVASFEEHAKRVWSVDFSQTDPTRFLSGSDDGTVRVWSLNDENAVASIDSKANVCSVQFSPGNSNLMAFGSANYRVYLYDLRNIQMPLAVIGGHAKAVSYVRWLGASHVVSASTDDTLKLWDVSRATLGGSLRPDVTFRGHVNEKNFVGLSVTADGYIAAGSEDNSLYCYHRAMPTPVVRHCFDDPLMFGGGAPPMRDSENPDAHQFISSVTWARRGGTCVAANSQGHIKMLQLA